MLFQSINFVKVEKHSKNTQLSKEGARSQNH